MLLSHRHRFIYIHIPKCAGTSITNSLLPFCDWPDRILGYMPVFEWYQKKFKHLDKHMRAYKVKNVVGEEIWKEYFKFTFVRNPFTRTVSYYTWIEKMVLKAREEKIRLSPRYLSKQSLFSFPVTQAYLKTQTFSEFIRHPGFLEDHGCHPQVEFINHPKTGEVEIDSVGKVETLEQDLHDIGSKLTNRALKIYKKNVSQRRDCVIKYFENKDDVVYIRSLYAQDFDQLGYADHPE